MPLTDVYVQSLAQFGDFFRTIRQGQAPERFTIQHLKDLGFTSTNHRAFIPLLKALGFLSPDGQPTARYHEYRNEAQARQIMAQALKDAYADLFVLRSHPAESDRPILEGKFKSTHNVSDRLAKLMASTFYALLALADLNAAAPGTPPPPAPIRDDEPPPPDTPDEKDESPARHTRQAATNLHYNIQIHLPATKDIEVFNAIFKSLKEHLLE